jgi:hypothetical protein
MILASIKPYYYYLIAEEKKKIEVRKSALKDLPQDIVFYMSKDEKSFAKIPKEFQEKYRKHFGKVGLAIVCDRIDEFYCASVPYQKENNLGYGHFVDNGVYKVNGWHEGVVFERNDRHIDSMLKNNDLKEMCLSAQEIFDYIGIGKHLYGWYISDLKIYDKPKELSEFTSPRVCGNYKDLPAYIHEGCNMCKYSYTINCMIKCRIDGREPLTRPPQSYMYVEEVGE